MHSWCDPYREWLSQSVYRYSLTILALVQAPHSEHTIYLFTHALTPHKATINKLLVVLKWFGGTAFLLPNVVRGLGHLKNRLAAADWTHWQEEYHCQTAHQSHSYIEKRHTGLEFEINAERERVQVTTTWSRHMHGVEIAWVSCVCTAALKWCM